MTKVTCIIPSTCSDRIFPHLKKCINSLHNSAEGNIVLTVGLVSENPNGRKNILGLKIDAFYLVDKDTGFARMNNVAIEETLNTYSPDYILLINDDAWVGENFFKIFLQTIRKKKEDVVIPLILDSEGKNIDSYGAEYFSSGFARDSKSFGTKTSLASAGCLLIKSNILKRIKKLSGFYFNPILSFYLEDVELSIRLKSLKIKFFKTPKLVAYHHGSLTSGKKSYFKYFHSYRNLIWIILIDWPVSVIAKNFFKILIFQGFVVIKGSIYFGLTIYPRIVWETLIKLKELLRLRNLTLRAYKKDFKFESIMNGHI